MNSKALKSLIYVMWISLIALSVLKIFFPEEFLLVLSNQKIILIGDWIDSHKVIEQILLFGFSYFTYFLYLCSCRQSWNLSLLEHLILCLVNISLNITSLYSSEIMLSMDLCAMVLLPCLFKAKYSQTATVFTAHTIGQLLLLFIRSKPILLVNVNFATSLLISFDSYLLLGLYYLYSNIYKEKPLWEEFVLRFSEITQKLCWKSHSRK